jgi:hypothetical protein
VEDQRRRPRVGISLDDGTKTIDELAEDGACCLRLHARRTLGYVAEDAVLRAKVRVGDADPTDIGHRRAFLA